MPLPIGADPEGSARGTATGGPPIAIAPRTKAVNADQPVRNDPRTSPTGKRARHSNMSGQSDGSSAIASARGPAETAAATAFSRERPATYMPAATSSATGHSMTSRTPRAAAPP